MVLIRFRELHLSMLGKSHRCKPASLSPVRTSNVSQNTSSDVMQVQALSDDVYVLAGAVTQAEDRG